MEKCDKKCYYKFNMTKKKEIGNLNASNSDTLTRSQSLNKKIILNSSNSQERVHLACTSVYRIRIISSFVGKIL